MRHGTVFIVAALACGCAGPPEFPSPPVIIIDIDTLRADHLGCYGYHRPTSPNIDAFSREAAFFTWAFAQAPNTPPSQASILTGLYPSAHGRIGNEQRVTESAVTLAEALLDAGYATAAYVDGGLMVRGFGLEQGFEVYEDEGGRLHNIGPYAEQWIRKRLASRKLRDQPFLLLIHTYDTHSPYEDTPEPYRSAFVGDVSGLPAEFRDTPSKHMAAVWNARSQRPPPSLSRQELDYARDLYDGGILHVDAWFGDFVRFLKKTGLYDRAILVFLSDHGDEFQEHGGLFHDRLWATVTRIPLMIRFPGGRHAGAYDNVVESIDLMPTLLDAVGLTVPEMVHGESLIGLLTGLGDRGSLALSESPYYGRRIAAASETHRLFFTKKTGSSELFRYREDPLEGADLGDRDEDQRLLLEERIRQWQSFIETVRAPAEEGPELSKEQQEQLRALGYLD